MINIPYLYIAMIMIVIWIIYRIFVLRKSKENSISREIVMNIFFIYFLLLVNLTICKGFELQINFNRQIYVNYIPLVETINMFKNNYLSMRNILVNIVGNIILFIPLGFFIPLLFVKKNKIGKVLLYGFLTSLAIEVLQLVQSVNISDIDDIIFNTLGTALGYFIFNIFYKIIVKTKHKKMLDNITSKFDGNLIIRACKQVGVMLVAIFTFSVITFYQYTLQGDLSNEEIAKSIFAYSENTEFQAVKDISKYKLFLKEEGDYLNVLSIEKIIDDRWSDSRLYIGQLYKKIGDYSVAIMNDGELVTVVAFGVNKGADEIKINFLGNEYSEELKEDGYFMTVFPNFEMIDEKSDFYNFFNGEEAKDIEIKFYNNGNEYNELKKG